MQFATSSGSLRPLLAHHTNHSRHAGLMVWAAKKEAGVEKRLQVRLPNGQVDWWEVANAKDVEKCLNTRKLGGGTLLDTSADSPEVIANFAKLQEGRVYQALGPQQISPHTIKVTLHLPVDDSDQYVTLTLDDLTQASLTKLIAVHNLDGLRPANQPGNIVLTRITSLEDGGEYIGVSAKSSALSSTVHRLERVDHNLEAANEDAVRERLHHLALEENPGAAVKSICRKAYSSQGLHVVEIDAAVKVTFPDGRPPIAYVAERKRTMTLNVFVEVQAKWALIKEFRDTVPELEEDYGGVQVAKLFVAADLLVAPLALEQVAEESRKRNICVLMRNGMEYSLENSCWPKP